MTAGTLTGIAPEAGGRARTRWVAIWRFDTDRGRQFHHVPLPLLTVEADRDEARKLAETQGPPML